MTDEMKHNIIKNFLIVDADTATIGDGTTLEIFNELAQVWGEEGVLYAEIEIHAYADNGDITVSKEREPVTQEEIGEALSRMFDDPEFEVGGAKYE